MTERPEWCHKVNTVCGCYQGSGPCRLDQEIINNYPYQNEKKQEIREEISRLAEKDPEQVARRCLRVRYGHY